MNYYPFHIGDYSTRTRHLSHMADLAYRRMIDLYYITEKPLPLEISKISSLIGMKGKEKIVSEIISDFFLKSEDGYRSEKCDAIIHDYQKKAARAKQANSKRWGNVPSETVLKSDMKSDPNQEPITNNQIIERENPASARPTIEQAEQFCRSEQMPETAIAEIPNWHSNRESQGWAKGNGMQITNWQADLKSWLFRTARGEFNQKTNHGNNHRTDKRNREFSEESISIPILS